MDPNLPNNQQPEQTVPPQPPAAPISAAQPIQPQNYTISQAEHNGKKAVLKVIILLVVIVGATLGIVYGAVTLMGQNKARTITQNANVFAEPTQVPVTPTPTGGLLNPNDTTDNAISQDSDATSKNLDNLDTSLKDADQSLQDQQTNLQ